MIETNNLKWTTV